jgi:hypothetical protein
MQLTCERRDKFCARAWAAEIRAFTILNTIQGSAIPIFYGHFSVEKKRELREDRVVRATLLQFVDAEPLSYEISSILSTEGKERVRQRVMALTKQTMEKKVFFPEIGVWNFLSDNKGNVRMTGFESSFDPKDHSMDEKAMQESLANSLIEVEDMLCDCGF